MHLNGAAQTQMPIVIILTLHRNFHAFCVKLYKHNSVITVLTRFPQSKIQNIFSKSLSEVISINVFLHLLKKLK